MVEDFDIGPLTWVKDEIDQALKNVQDNLAAVSDKPDDVASLRFSQTHLYQVSGALDMVGLEGCKRFCSEIGNVASKLEKGGLQVSPEILATLSQSVHTLSHYLQELLNGSPDLPLKLFPQLQALMALQGESAEESELFFPDTSLRAPKDTPSRQLDEVELTGFVTEQRSLFQRSLLDWLKNKSDSGLHGMTQALENIQQVQQQPAQKTLWWSASAFAETLAQQEIAARASVKKVCRRLDQQLKTLGEGAQRGSGHLLRDVLYYIAISAPATPRIAQVKQVFELDELLPGHQDQAAPALEIAQADIELAEQLANSVDTIKEQWNALSDGRLEALDALQPLLAELVQHAEPLRNDTVQTMLQAIRAFAAQVQQDIPLLTDHAIIEVAAGLALSEDALRDYRHLDRDAAQRLADQARVIATLGQASQPGTAEPKLGQDVLAAMAQPVKDALHASEAALDTYFRDPTQIEVLEQVVKPLQQVVAAFDMLNMPVPTRVAASSLLLVEYFRSGSAEPDHALFELLAESLSMLGLFVDELPRIRSESEAALQSGLGRLLQQLELLNLGQPQAADSPLAVPEAAPDSTTTDRAHDAELLDIYLTEAEEVLAHVAQNLQALRVNATNHEALAEVRRGFHTLKGSGRAVGLSTLAEVAWAIEKLLNLVMERKLAPSPGVLSLVEHTGSAFADWVATLRQQGAVEISPLSWQQQAATLEAEIASQKAKAVAEEVIIGGTHRISRALFDIFMGEAGEHMHTLRHEVEATSAEHVGKPSSDSRRAAHTLASNAGTAGFKAIANLSRALEHWLDAHSGRWNAQQFALLGNVVDALGKMLEKAAQMRQPKQITALLAAVKQALQDATAQQLPESAETTDLAPADAGTVSPDTLGGEPVTGTASTDTTTEAAITEDVAAVQPHTVMDDVPAFVSQADAPAAPPVDTPTALETPASAASAVLPASDLSEAGSFRPTARATAVDSELLSMFIEEARELVPAVGNQLRAWRHDPQESDHPDELQRALHTLKGSARMASQSALADTVHDMEDRVIRALKNKKREIDFDGLFVDLDQIGGLLEDAVKQASGTGKPELQRPGRAVERSAQYLRMRAEVLDRLINEAGEISIARSRMDREMQGFKQFSLDLTESVQRLRNQLREMEIEAESQLQSRMADLQESQADFDPLEFDRFTRLQELTRLMAESVNDVATIQHGLLMNLDETESALQQQNRMNRELQHGLMNVRMVPFSMIAERLQRIVRQTARELGKQVEMHIDGEHVDIDRSVLDKIGAPLEHLLRNAVAHGMESPAERSKARKPATGQVALKVRRENDEIIITVSDDGGGINLGKVRSKAIEQGMFGAEQEVSEQTLMQVIFESGFSTASDVSQIAGRGVGLDSVRTDITALGGRIDVSNAQGQGAVFNIYLPVTLSVAQVVVVRSGNRTFALPSVMVEQVQKLKPGVLADGYAAQAITWSERSYPIHHLSKLIGDHQHVPEHQLYVPVLLLRSGTYQIALHVDEILGNQEVVMKPIGPQLARVPGMIGATVMGDGSIVLILNAVQMANREDLAAGVVRVSHVAATPEAVSEDTVILVVDDSLTMRKVLGRLLEREGYRVVIAKDGMDALQVLQELTPDIILSDIEMPRMDGFELVRNIRADQRLAAIPLIIISSRTAEKHRNLARELGVNGYLGKPVQDDELLMQISTLLGRAAPLGGSATS